MDTPDFRRRPSLKAPWIMAMQWHDLAFLHWPVSTDRLRSHIPARLELQTYDGAAWLGVVPFLMRGVRVRGLPALPGTGAFAELNLRTYVIADGKPGVWFFSLDAASRLAVRIARRTFHLPYFDATMKVATTDGQIEYSSTRTEHPPGNFHCRFGPKSDVFYAAAGSIEHWFTERYCLYAADPRDRVYRGEIQHKPWPLQLGQCEIQTNTIASQLGIELPTRPAYVHFAKRLDVVAWYLRPLTNVP